MILLIQTFLAALISFRFLSSSKKTGKSPSLAFMGFFAFLIPSFIGDMIYPLFIAIMSHYKTITIHSPIAANAAVVICPILFSILGFDLTVKIYKKQFMQSDPSGQKIINELEFPPPDTILVQSSNEKSDSLSQNNDITTFQPTNITRPPSVTIVAWIIVVFGGYALLSMGIAVAIGSSDYYALLTKNTFPVPFQMIFGFIGGVVTILSGIFILKGASWARRLYITWGAISIPFTFFNVGFTLIILPSLAIYALFTAVLLQKNNSDFFLGNKD